MLNADITFQIVMFIGFDHMFLCLSILEALIQGGECEFVCLSPLIECSVAVLVTYNVISTHPMWDCY